MFDFFGADTLLAVRFLLAFIVVLACDRRSGLGGTPTGQRTNRSCGAGATAAPGGQ